MQTISLKWSTTLNIFGFYQFDILGQILGVISFPKFTLSRGSRSTLQKLDFFCQILINFLLYDKFYSNSIFLDDDVIPKNYDVMAGFQNPYNLCSIKSFNFADIKTIVKTICQVVS